MFGELSLGVSLDKAIKGCVSGKARTSANWHLAKAVALLAHRLFISSKRVVDRMKAIWRFGNLAMRREDFMKLWLVDVLARREGLWFEFVSLLSVWNAKLQSDGEIRVPWGHVRLHINMSAQHWNRSVRVCCWLWGFDLAVRQNRETFDWDMNALDLQLLGRFRDPGLASRLTGGMESILAFGLIGTSWCQLLQHVSTAVLVKTTSFTGCLSVSVLGLCVKGRASPRKCVIMWSPCLSGWADVLSGSTRLKVLTLVSPF